MSKIREKKEQVVDQLSEILSKCKVGVLTDYRGLSAAEMTRLRHKLREAGIEYRVVKNTLARFAAEKAGRNELGGLFDGPVAIAFGYGEVTEPAKALADYIKSSKSTLKITGGFLEVGLLTPDDVTKLAKLPSKEILLSQVLGGLQSPMVNLVGCLAAPVRGVMGVLQARIKQLEGE